MDPPNVRMVVPGTVDAVTWSLQHANLADLDLTDPLFDSLRDDYPGFERWAARALVDGRPIWVARNGELLGVAIAKPDDDTFHLAGQAKATKLSLLKTAPDAPSGVGIALIEAVLGFCRASRTDVIWLTVLEAHTDLIAFVTNYGFRIVPGLRSPVGELVMMSTLTMPAISPTGRRTTA